jgi:hypothetical protein
MGGTKAVGIGLNTGLAFESAEAWCSLNSSSMKDYLLFRMVLYYSYTPECVIKLFRGTTQPITRSRLYLIIIASFKNTISDTAYVP